ncbi:MAG: hypothetical protein K6E10_06635, partial [Eubacterium sp.]|nr:hypothetical protein [Eubacterium sp.]
MKSKLSAFKYIKNNKRTVGTLLIAVTLSFVTMYVVYVMLAITYESVKPIMLEMPKHISYLGLSPEGFGISEEDYDFPESANAAYQEKKEELIDKLKEKEGINDAYDTQVLTSSYTAVFGGINYRFPLIEADKIPEFLDHMDSRLVSGRMPEGQGEILVDQVILKNQNIKIGDWYMKEWLGETFKIVGAVQSDYMISVGTPHGFTNTGWYIVVLNDENTCDMKKMLEENGYKICAGESVIDASSYKEDYQEEK